MILVDASKHAGPALWQGLMLIALIPTLFAMFSNWGFKGKNIWWIVGTYLLLGIVLMIWIVRSHV